MWELDCKESWASKNCCFWSVVLEKTIESPLECKEIKPINPKGNQHWIFFLFYFIFKIYIIILVLPNIKMNPPQVYMWRVQDGEHWIFIGRLMLKLKSNPLATWCKELTHWKRPWCWERLKAGREGEDRGWDGWMASPRWTWVWASSGSWWWTGKPGKLQTIELQIVGHDWMTDLNWTEWYSIYDSPIKHH